MTGQWRNVTGLVVSLAMALACNGYATGRNADLSTLEDCDGGPAVLSDSGPTEDRDSGGFPDPSRDGGSTDPGPDAFVPPDDRPWEALLSQAVGFGRHVTGGAGTRVCRVSNLEDSGDGSLRSCTKRSGGWIVFDVSGEIALRSPIRVGSNQTIDGRGQNVLLTSRGLSISNRENVVVHNLRIADCDGDAVTVYRSANVWVDHVSASNCGDGLLDITEQSHAVTASWNAFSDHNKTMLVGANNSRTEDAVITVTLHHNLFRNTIRRNPYARFGSVHMFNNLLVEWGEKNGGDAVNSASGAQIALENNVFVAGLNPVAVRNTIPKWNEVEGFVRASGNLALNGAMVESFHPEQVFDPSATYFYSAEPADAELRSRIEAQAGWQQTLPPPGL